ncbi:MAG: hypothetical protein V4584_03220 [Verrucomicrobiota bacterium]
MARTLFQTGILLACISMTSCIGGAVIREQRRPMTRFNIEKSVRVIHGGNLGRNPTAKEIVSWWGEPDRKETVKSGLVWTYNTKPAMKGLVLFYYLPLPLGVPDGYNGIDFYFKNHATSPWRAVERTTGISGGYLDVSDSDETTFHRIRD